MFLKAHSFPQAALSKNSSLLEQLMSADKYPRIFLRQMEAIVCIFWRVCLKEVRVTSTS